MNKIYAAIGIMIIATACTDSIAPDKNARHLGSVLSVNACSTGFNVSTSWADATYKAEFMRNGSVVSTVSANSRASINSGCVYKTGDKAFVRFTPLGDITRYLDVTDSRVITIQ